MQPTFEFCQNEERRQRAIAADAPLQNSRAIATRAANAWAKEGEYALKRASRKDGLLSREDQLIAEEFRLEGDLRDDAPIAIGTVATSL